MDLINIFLVVVATVTFFLGFSTLFQNKNKKITAFTLAFPLLAFDVGFWSVSIILFRFLNNPETSFIAAKFLYTIPVFIPVLFLYFVSIFTKPDFKYLGNKIAIWFSILVSLFFIIAVIATDLIITGVEVPFEGEKILFFGGLYVIYIFHYLFFFGSAFILLIKEYFNVKDILRKNQIKNLFIGTFIASSVALTTNLILPWFGYFELNWLGNIMGIFFVGFILYAIVAYKLFDLRLIAIEVFIVFIVTFLGVEIFLVADLNAFIIKAVVLISVSLLSYFLVKSAYKEVETREEIERLAKDLQRANFQLKELDQRKSEFLSLASHQLRTPLTAIKGYSSMLLEGSFGEVSEKPRDAISHIFESSKRLVFVIQDFLTISRIEQNRLEYNFELTDLAEIVKTTVDEMKVASKDKGIKISLDLKLKNVPIHVDTEKIKQVLGNLIDNAIKYTPKGTIKVSLNVDTEKNKAILSVSDSGVGMSQETIDKLFKKFSRADDASKINVSGSGLGLYVAKLMIEAHKGTIRAKSDGKEKGSTFTVELPLNNDSKIT